MAPEHGKAVELEPGLRRVLAPNPSPMTGPGTNSYLVGTDEVVLVDPGPDDPAHVAALLAAVGRARVGAILVTHAHLDHSAAAPRLSALLHAPVLAFGLPEAGRSPVMQALAAGGLAGGGEGVDAGFRPDATLADGDRVAAGGTAIEVLHAPGHFAGHLAFGVGDVVLTGDHVLGWTSTLVSPPDGDVAAFMATCARLRRRGARVFHAGHGAPVDDPAGRLDWLVEHRRSRETAILAALGPVPRPVGEITARVYTDVAPALLPAAERNVFAHLVDLSGRNLARPVPRLSASARFAAV